MTALLVTLTVIEVVLVVAVLAYYLARIGASLRRTSALLAKVTFGVRAIERQTEPVGPRLREINGALEQAATALDDLAAPSARS